MTFSQPLLGRSKAWGVGRGVGLAAFPRPCSLLVKSLCLIPYCWCVQREGAEVSSHYLCPLSSVGFFAISTACHCENPLATRNPNLG